MTNNAYDFSTTAADNVSSLTGINWNEGQLAPTLNNSARSTLAYIAALIDVVFGGIDSGGSANAYTFASPTNFAFTAYARGQAISFKANFTNSGASTLNVDGLGAKTIQKAGAALASGDIVSGGFYRVIYDGTQFQLENVIPSQPLDATLTAIAALTIQNGTIIVGTGTDAFTATTSPDFVGTISTGSGDSGPKFANPYWAWRKANGTREGYIQHLDGAGFVITNEVSGQNIDFNTTGGGTAYVNGSILLRQADSATQADQEAASSTALHVSPGRQHFHPSASKAWARWNMTGTPAFGMSYASSSITDTATGRQSLNMSITMSAATWAPIFGSGETSAAANCNAVGVDADNTASVTTTAVAILSQSSSGTDEDRNIVCVDAKGDI